MIPVSPVQAVSSKMSRMRFKLSVIVRPGTEPVWSVFTTDSNTLRRRFARALAAIL